MEREYYEDDRPIVIPDDIKKMSKDEINAEIKRLEAEAAAEKERILKRT